MTIFMLLPLLACGKHKIKNMEQPTAEEIFAAYQQKLEPDGPNNIDLQNVHMLASMTMPMMGEAIPVDTWVIKDVGMTNSMTIPNIGTISQGYNMEHAWILDPMKGDRLLTGVERTDFITEYQSTFADSFADVYKEAVVIGMKEINDEWTWEVKAVNVFANSPTTLFFGVDSKLCVAQFKDIAQGKGSIKAKIFLKEYSDFNGYISPKIVEIKTMGITQTMTFENVEINVANPPSIDVPQSIQAFITPIESPPPVILDDSPIIEDTTEQTAE